MKKVIFSSSWNIIAVLGWKTEIRSIYTLFSPWIVTFLCIVCKVLNWYYCVFFFESEICCCSSPMWRKSGNMVLFSCNEIMAQRVALYIDTRRQDTTSRLLSWDENSNYCKLELNYHWSLCVHTSGETLRQNNCQLIGSSLIVLAWQAQKN